MTGLNTYERADGTVESIHMHEVNGLLSRKGSPDAVHAELAQRLGFETVDAFLAVNGGNLKKVATPATEDVAAA